MCRPACGHWATARLGPRLAYGLRSFPRHELFDRYHAQVVSYSDDNAGNGALSKARRAFNIQIQYPMQAVHTGLARALV